MSDRNSRSLRWLERVLIAVGLTCLGYYGYQTAEARHFQQRQTAALVSALDERKATSAAETNAPGAVSPPDAPVETAAAMLDESTPHAVDAKAVNARGPGEATRSRRGSTMGAIALLEIPRLKMSSAVLSGDGDEVLDVAIGHLPDTPKPWEPGNSAMAAHRDGLFRPLRNIRVGDEIRVRSEHGDITYQVRQTRIVQPDDLSVLRPTRAQTLTLITCYPFNFVGNAPKRFIVHAERVDAPTP